MFKSFQSAPVSSTLYQSGLRTFSPGQFEYDAIHDRLPVVSWLVPTSYQSEHPDYTPAAGADFVASKIDAIAANPDVWAKTVFILNYDENDGIFDHVVPPTAAGRARPDEFVDGDAHRRRASGCRASSCRRGRRAAGSPARPSTTLRCCSFLEVLTGVTIPNITPWRRATFGDLTSAFGAARGGFPRLPDTKAQLARAVQEVTTLPAPVFPGANQVPPVQQHGNRPRPRR